MKGIQGEICLRCFMEYKKESLKSDQKFKCCILENHESRRYVLDLRDTFSVSWTYLRT